MIKAIKDDLFCLGSSHPWVEAISCKAKENVLKMEAQLAKEVVPFNFLTPMKIIRDAIWVQCKLDGDSGFGFSAMEVETLVRYQLPVVVIVFNNGGVYGGDRRNPDEINGPYKDDPAPTYFVPSASYHTLIEAFGGKGYLAGTPEELKSALAESFAARKPAVINVIIDPYAGAESGRRQQKN